MRSSSGKELELSHKCYPNIDRRRRMDKREAMSTLRQRANKKSLDKGQEREDKRLEEDN